MGGLKIIGVKIVGMCSKCRQEGDEIMKDITGRVYEDSELSCVGCAFGGISKVKQRWEVMREQEKEFIRGMPKFVNGIETELFFKGIRQTEYRRGKEDALSTVHAVQGGKLK